MEMRVGVRAEESGVVPKNRMMLMGLAFLNHSVLVHMLAVLAKREVFPQPPSPYSINSLSESLVMYWWMCSKLSSRP
jgi:hypothetical protein